MKRNDRVMPVNLKITAGIQTDAQGRRLPDVIAVELNGELAVVECTEADAKSFVGEVRSVVKEWLSELQ